MTERECCPVEECRSQMFVARVGGILDADPDRPRYRCEACGHEFDDPDTREDGKRVPPNSPHAKTLHEADPDTEIRPKGGSD